MIVRFGIQKLRERKYEKMWIAKRIIHITYTIAAKCFNFCGIVGYYSTQFIIVSSFYPITQTFTYI